MEYFCHDDEEFVYINTITRLTTYTRILGRNTDLLHVDTADLFFYNSYL